MFLWIMAPIRTLKNLRVELASACTLSPKISLLSYLVGASADGCGLSHCPKQKNKGEEILTQEL